MRQQVQHTWNVVGQSWGEHLAGDMISRCMPASLFLVGAYNSTVNRYSSSTVTGLRIHTEIMHTIIWISSTTQAAKCPSMLLLLF